MGRTAREYPKGRLKLRTPRTVRQDKTYPLYIEYNWQGDSVRKATGVSVFAKEWNEKGYNAIGEIRATKTIDYKYYNSMLHKRVADIDAKIMKYYEQHHHITCNVIRSFLEDNDEALRVDGGKDFVSFAKEMIKARYDKGKIAVSTWKNAVSYLNKFAEFLLLEHKGTHGADKELIYVSEISEDIIIDFRKYRLLAKKKVTTVNKTLCPILNACQYACQLGYISHRLNKSLQELYMKEEDNLDAEEQNIKYLRKEQLQELIEKCNTNIPPRRREFLDMWFFSFHACGLRMVDMMTLRWKDIDMKKKEIRKIQVKTRNRNSIPLTEPLLQFLEKWKGRNNVYVFDLLPENFDINDEEAVYRRRNSWNNTINTSLRALSHEMEWEQDLTFHVARHTWAVMALDGGASISEISRLLGHASTAVTERVYAEFMPESLASVVDKLGFDYVPKM